MNKLQWSTEKPKTEGWYFFKYKPRGNERVLWVNKELYYENEYPSHRATRANMDGLWAGPIEMPVGVDMTDTIF